jgi:hypothetical protein
MVAFPSSPKPRSARVSFIPNVSITTSEFTFQTRKQVHAGQRWEIDLELPPMTGEQAGQWLAFIVKMNGVEGTSQVPDPDRQTAYGIATGTPLVKGASQTGGTVITDGWTTSQTGIMKAGDLLQIGDYMYMVLDDANSDGSGDATINIGPDLRSSPADNAAITVADVTTKCRLAGNSQNWTTDNMKNYGISISFMEELPTS